MFSDDILLFRITGGVALAICKQFIEDKERVRLRNIEMIEKMARAGRWECKPEEVQVWSSREDGMLTAIAFPGKQPDTWTKPDSKGRSTPKKNSDEYQYWKERPRYESASSVIAGTFKVPLSIGYTTAGGGEGWSMIGRPLSECGFLYWPEKDLYGMWVPDIPKILVEFKESMKRYKSLKLNGNIEKWKPEFDGAVPMLQEEWDVLIANAKLEDKMKKSKTPKKAPTKTPKTPKLKLVASKQGAV